MRAEARGGARRRRGAAGAGALGAAVESGALSATGNAAVQIVLAAALLKALLNSKKLPEATSAVLSALSFHVFAPACLLYSGLVASTDILTRDNLLFVLGMMTFQLAAGRLCGWLAESALGRLERLDRRRTPGGLPAPPGGLPAAGVSPAAAIAASTASAVGVPGAEMALLPPMAAGATGWREWVGLSCVLGNALTLPLSVLLLSSSAELYAHSALSTGLALAVWTPVFWGLTTSAWAGVAKRMVAAAEALRAESGSAVARRGPAAVVGSVREEARGGEGGAGGAEVGPDARAASVDVEAIDRWARRTVDAEDVGARKAYMLGLLPGRALRWWGPVAFSVPLLATLAGLAFGRMEGMADLAFGVAQPTPGPIEVEALSAASASAMELLRSLTAAAPAVLSLALASLIHLPKHLGQADADDTLVGGPVWTSRVRRLIMPGRHEAAAAMLVAASRFLFVPGLTLLLYTTLVAKGVITAQAISSKAVHVAVLLQSCMPPAQMLLGCIPRHKTTVQLRTRYEALLTRVYAAGVVPVAVWLAVFIVRVSAVPA
ncbi:unnamed protein product [Pedinophyceae sp. YPF-701]|nr:unnamed protein product [Pedinophyceae sp. YPF-701]